MAQKFLVNIDLAGNELQNAKIHKLGAAPTGLTGTDSGLTYYNTATNAAYIWNGSAWVSTDASKFSGTIPNTALINSTITIGSTSTALGATNTALAGLTGLTAAAGAYNFNWASSTGTFSTGSGSVTLNGDTTISGTKTFGTGTGAVSLNGDVTIAATKTLTLSGDPTNALHAATKQYVDNSAQGLDAKPSVQYASTAALAVASRTTTTLTTALTAWSPDGTAVVNGDIVLLKDSTTGTGSGPHDNGIYTISGVGSAIVLTRTNYADSWAEYISAYVWVEKGSALADTGWLCTVDAGGTLGTTSLTWVLFASAGATIAGNGLTKSGNTIDVVSHAGSASTIGTINIGADAIGVNLGTTSTTAAPGDHTHANMALTTGNLSQFAATTSLQLLNTISDETGSGSLVFATTPTLVTPILGVATATSINKVALTQPATSATLTIADGKTLTSSNTITFTGTDSASVAVGTGGTVVYTANKLSVHAATTSAELAGVISDEVGTDKLVFNTTPTFVTSVLTSSTSFDVFDTTATTVNAFGAATTLNLGHDGTTASTTGIATGALASGTKTVNIGTGASAGTTNINIGASSGTTTINSGTLVGAATTQNLFDTVATTVNAFGVATTASIGYDGTAASTTNISTGATATATTKTVNIATGGAAGSTTNVSIGSSVAGTTTISSPTTTLGASATVNIGTTGGTATTVNLMTGLTNASAKTLNIGTGSSGGAQSTVIGGSLTFNGHQSAGFVKTNASGVVSVDTTTYLSTQSSDFKVVTIDNTDSGQTWSTADATGATANTTGDTVKFVAALTNATAGIQLVSDATNKAIGIRHADTSSATSIDNSANQQFLKSVTVDEFGHITAVTSGTPSGSVSKYAVDVGDNSAVAITLTHNLGTKDVTVEVFDNNTPYARVFTDVEHTTINTVILRFAVAPTTAQYRAVVMG